ncbi:MerR family transcriptional regulator [Amylibacter kogurei]|uniref:MerR family transcriptional regulator n=1 Tax=Paramylibacter kogurei TaxID=1889778 RepID=A0A2G5KC02_9RHOB|nr:MerR family DNA-binding transcriptional regulator [Amylibacter kogurei]PIB26164.1 MerR family transcriptional regulator [Amylibacter kogurei]
MTQSIKTLKEMCEEFDVTPRTLRYYEYIELLSPEKQGRTRLYGAKERARMKLIMRGRRFGFSLEEVRQWLELYDQDPSQRVQMESLLERSKVRMKDLRNRKKELEEAISELQDLIKIASESLDKD